jgi:hypothetical protein
LTHLGGHEEVADMEPREQDPYARRGRKGCPPHDPILVEGVERGYSRVARCPACGLTGTEGRDTAEAMRAFDGGRTPARRPPIIHPSA